MRIRYFVNNIFITKSWNWSNQIPLLHTGAIYNIQHVLVHLEISYIMLASSQKYIGQW